MNNPDHISESLKIIFWVKTYKIFDADPGQKNFVSRIRDGKISDPVWKKFGSRIQDKHPGSATLCCTL
jgi:hypothetical protein